MKVIHLNAEDEYHLKQRNKIETFFNLLKEKYNLVTSKARSIDVYLAGIDATLCAYQLSYKNKLIIQLYEMA